MAFPSINVPKIKRSTKLNNVNVTYLFIEQKNKQNLDLSCIPFCVEKIRLNQPDTIHLHDFHQMTIVLNGRGAVVINGLKQQIRTGNVYVINSYSPHCLQDFTELEYVNILFRMEELLKYAGSLKTHPGFQALFMVSASGTGAICSRILTF